MPSEAPRAGEVLYVAGYWALPGNAKRPVGHYWEQIPRSLGLIAGQRLLLLHDDPATAEAFVRFGAPLGVDVKAEHVPLAELPGARHAERLAALCAATPLSGPGAVPASGSEKGYKHLTRDLEGSGEEIYRALISIWMSKVPLTAAVAARVGAETDSIAWMDVSIARFSERRTNWDFTRQPFQRSALNHYASPMRAQGRPLPLNASFLRAVPDVWARIAEEFDRELEGCLTEAYGHDEETLLARVHRRRPELFHTIGVPLPRPGQGGALDGVKRRLRAIFG